MLPTYIIDSYLLDYIGINQGFFNVNEFYEQVVTRLIPQLNPYPLPHSVIVLDNVSIYNNPQVREAIKEASYLLKYLPSYSLDFNPMELIFSVIKAQIQRHFNKVQLLIKREGRTFSDFIKCIVEESKYDQYPQKHFRYSVSSYIYEVDIQDIKREVLREIGLI